MADVKKFLSEKTAWVLLAGSLLYEVSAAQPFLVAHRSLVLVTLVLIGFAVFVVWTSGASDARATRTQRLALILFALVFATLVSLTAGATLQGDESLYSRYAAQLFLHGHNPYTVNITNAAQIFGQTQQFLTRSWDGTIATTYPYPAGTIYLVSLGHLVPGFPSPTVAIDVVAMLATMVLLVRRFGWELGAVYATLLVVGNQLNILALGNSDILIVPFLVYLIPRIPSLATASRRATLLFAVTFGALLAVKQDAWLLAPFLLAAVRSFTAEGPKRRRLLFSISLVAGVTFLALNAPFALRDGSAWWRAMTAPFRSNVVMGGEGLSNVIQYFGGTVSGSYAALAGLTFLAGLALSLFLKGRASLLMILFGVVPTVVSDRSFTKYLFALLIVAVVALLSAPFERSPRLARGAVVVLPFLILFPAIWSGRTPATAVVVTRAYAPNGDFVVSRLDVSVNISGVNPRTLRYVPVAQGVFMADWKIASVTGHRVTITPRGDAASPLRTNVPFQINAVDTRRREVFASSAVNLAPFSIRVANHYDANGYLIGITVHLLGPREATRARRVRFFTMGGAANLVKFANTVDAGAQWGEVRTSSRGGAEVGVRCVASSVKTYVVAQVFDQYGQTISLSPAYRLSCHR